MIRRATPDDLPAWLAMRAALWPDCDSHQHEAREILDHPDQACLLAIDEGTPVGFVELSLRPFVDGCTSSPVAYLEGWYVDDARRRTGLGRALVDAAYEWARALGCREIGSDCLIDNRTSEAAHRALGFREVNRVIRWARRLDPPA